MGLLDAFRDPADRPKAIGIAAAITIGVVAAGYYFWIQRNELAQDVKKASHNVNHAARKAGDEVSSAAHTVGQKVGHAAHSVGDHIGNAAHSVNNLARRAGVEIGDAAQRVGHTVGHTAQRVGENVGHAAHKAGEATVNAAHRVGHVVGNTAHKVGEGVGYAAHKVGDNVSYATHKAGENIEYAAHKVGETVSHATHKVGETVSEAAHATGHKIAQTVHDLKESAERMGNTVEEDIKVGYKRISERIPEAATRLESYKSANLERYFNAKKVSTVEEFHQLLSLDALKKLQEVVMEMSENEFRKNLKLNREQRRAHLAHDKPHYEEIVIDGRKDFEKIFNDNLKVVLQDFGVSQDKYEASVGEHVKDDQEIALFGTQLYDIMVKRMQPINLAEDATAEYAEEVAQHLATEYHSVLYRPLRKAYFTAVREQMLYDKIHETFGLEEEDLKEMRKIFQASNVQTLFIKLEQAVQKDEETFGNFPKRN